eukprot:g60962.t1
MQKGKASPEAQSPWGAGLYWARRPEVTDKIYQRPPSFIPCYKGRALNGLHGWLEAEVWQKKPRVRRRKTTAAQNVYRRGVRASTATRRRRTGARIVRSPFFGRGNGVVVDQQLNALVEMALKAREPALSGTLWAKEYVIWDGAPASEMRRFRAGLEACTGLRLAGELLWRLHPLAASALSFLYGRFGRPSYLRLRYNSYSLKEHQCKVMERP